MSRFCSPREALDEAPSPARAWLYLGKDLKSRAAVEERVGPPPGALGGKLREEALRLKGPFLDLVAGLGRGQSDPAAWWAGTLPWKAWSASDLFLLCCYQSLAAESSAELVVIEDPWLLRQLGGKSSVRQEQAALLVLGLGRRLKWALRMAWGALLQAWHCRGSAPVLPQGAVVLYSHLQERSLSGTDGWTDHYLPGFEEELRAAGTGVLRCTYPDDTGFEAALAQRFKSVVPLIRFASLSGFSRALLGLPPAVPGGQTPDGRPIDELLKRERWQDFSRAGRCAALFLKDCAERFLRAGAFKVLVFPWENQPQERMLLLAARDQGLKTIGYQHTTVPRLQLPFFAGQGEAQWAPLPDVVLTSGPYPLRLLSEDGMPPERLRLAGSRRYASLSTGAATTDASADVLVILPVDRAQARHLLGALAQAYPQGGRGFRFLVKPHPSEPLSPQDLGFAAELAEGTLQEALARCQVVVFTGTTSGVEALSAGKRVLRYRPELLLDVDPCELLDDEALPTAGDADLAKKLEALRLLPGADAAQARAALSELFSPVLPDIWRNAVEDGPRRTP